MAPLLNKQQFIAAYGTAPKAVRDVMSGDETLQTINHIGATYNLHVDVVGKISEQLGYMLLGLLDPSTFYQNLLDLGIDAQNANLIIKEVNERIFQPLQKRVREEPSAPVAEEEEPEGEYDPNFQPLTAPQVSQPAEPQVPAMRIVAPVQPVPISTPPPSYNLIQPDNYAPAAPPAQFRTMQSDMVALQHPETHPAVVAASRMPSIPHPSQVSPARSFQTASVPYTSTPTASAPAYEQIPQNIPPTLQQAPAPSFPQTPQPPVQAFQAQGSDPYRETVN